MHNAGTRLDLRIDWSEIDSFGHVNNLAILKYVQAARVHFMEGVGLMPLDRETKIGPILASINCRFRKPLFYPGQVSVSSRVDVVNNTSFRIVHTVVDGKGAIAAEAQDIVVLFDFVNKAKRRIPDDLRARLASAVAPPG